MNSNKSIYNVERDGISVGIRKRNDVFNEGGLTTYKLRFDEVAIANIKTLRQRLEEYRLLEPDDEGEIDANGEVGGKVFEAARSVAYSAPEEIGYALEGYADHWWDYRDELAEWADRILEEIKD